MSKNKEPQDIKKSRKNIKSEEGNQEFVFKIFHCTTEEFDAEDFELEELDELKASFLSSRVKISHTSDGKFSFYVQEAK